MYVCNEHRRRFSLLFTTLTYKRAYGFCIMKWTCNRWIVGKNISIAIDTVFNVSILYPSLRTPNFNEEIFLKNIRPSVMQATWYYVQNN